jgi:hypothetical protein
MWLLPAGAASAAWRVHSASYQVTVIAKGLDNPRHITIGPDGRLYVAEAGHGGPTSGAGSNCVAVHDETGNDTACEGPTGAIAAVDQLGHVSTVLAGLPSVESQNTSEVAGPAAVAIVNGQLHLVEQDVAVSSNGTNPFGTAGVPLGQEVTAPPLGGPSSWLVGPNFAAYAANHPETNPGGPPGAETAYDSDPYAITPYAGGYAVADAAANDLLWVAPSGAISLIARFPTEEEGGVAAQAVPTSVTVGPDGALYVGQLVGVPSLPGTARVFRVVPGSAPTVFASGLTAITDLAFDSAGGLLLTEFNVGGLTSSTPNNGALVEITPTGQHITLVTGLNDPTGLALDQGVILMSVNGASTASSATPGEIVAALGVVNGYREVAADGGAFNFGASPFLGSLGGVKLDAPIVATADDPLGPGYWMVGSDGGVFSFGIAGFYGSTGGVALTQPIVGMAVTPDGRGYWLVAADGGVFAFGDATFHGSLGGISLAAPITGIAATGDGGGYWLVGRDGGIFAFGDARFDGSAAGAHLNAPVVGITSDLTSRGYWLVGADGGVFNYGDARYFGSAGGAHLTKPVVGLAPTPDDGGYWLFASDGGVFTYGDGAFDGSAAGARLVAPVIAGAAP